MFAAISRRLSRSSAPQPSNILLSQVVETVGGGIEKARDFEKLLIPAIASANDYFARQIEAIPGPVDISRQFFGMDAAAAAIFPETDEIIRALGRSLEVKDSLHRLAAQSGDHVHALLGVRRKPSANGNGEGFADHTIRSLAPGLKDTRDYLAFAAFKRILNDFAEHVNKLRRKDHLLKMEWNIQNDVAAKLSPAESMEYVSVHDLTPETLLQGVIGWLSSPEKYLRLEDTGVSLPAGAAQSEVSQLPLLHCSDRRQWLVCLIRFPVAEGLQALEQETHHHRHIFI
ncbi:MAG: hypothetical protein WAV95_18820 [Azonexus sp.]